MKWRPLEADGGRTDSAIYIVIAARWRPVEADGGRTGMHSMRPVESFVLVSCRFIL